MTIREAEALTGLSRSNIRFYEKEGLMAPARLSNGYRDYSEDDVAHLRKIVFLRTLGLSVEDIRGVIAGKETLHAALERQLQANAAQQQNLEQVQCICQEMLADPSLTYADLQIEQYMEPEAAPWPKQQLRYDALNLMTAWGSRKVSRWLAAISLLLALVSLPFLPGQIPIKWEEGVAVSHAPAWVILAYPAACLLMLRCLRPALDATLRTYFPTTGDMTADYTLNALCTLLVLIEGFTLLYLLDIVRSLPLLLTAGVTGFGVIFLLGLFQQW